MSVSKEREDAKLRMTKLKIEVQQAIPAGTKLDEVVLVLIELAQLYQNEIIVKEYP